MKNLRDLYYKIWPGFDSLKSSEYLVCENKVHVGKIDGYDAYVTYLYNHYNPFYDEDYIVFNVIYDYQESIKASEFYEYDRWDSTYINEDDISIGEHEVSDYVDGKFGAPRKIKVEFFDNYQDLVYDEVYKQSSINISKRYHKISTDLHVMLHSKDKKGLEYQILYQERELLSKKYLNCEKTDKIEKQLDIYKSMTEEEYTEKSERESKLMRDIMKDFDFDKFKNESKVVKTYKNFIKNR